MARIISIWLCTLLLAFGGSLCGGVRNVRLEEDEWKDDDMQQQSSASTKSTRTGELSTGVAFMGGGFMGLASASGFVAGLAAANKQQSGNGTIAKAMENVKAISCNSGGCWFSAPLLWSVKFNRLLEDMADSPSTAGQRHSATVANAVKQLSVWDPQEHPIEVSCCDRKWPVVPCGIGIFGKPDYIKLHGRRFCCPRALTNNCDRKGLAPCGSGFWGKRHEVLFGETKYCCRQPNDAEAFNEGSGCLNLPPSAINSAFGDIFGQLSWYMFNSELNYKSIIERVVEITGDFNSSDPISTPPMPWAVGKDFYVVTNIIAPSPAQIGPLTWCTKSAYRMTAVLDENASQVLDNWTCHGEFCGSQVPASFSVTLGSSRSPRNFTSMAARDALGMAYSVKRFKWGFWHGDRQYTRRSTDPLPAWANSWEAPIKSAVAASSAVAAMAAVGSANEFIAALQRGLPVWLSQKLSASAVQMFAADSSMDDSSFQLAAESVFTCPEASSVGTEMLANKHAMALSDGKTNDDVGIAQLIAEGHTNIVVIYNINNFSPENEKSMHSFHQYLSGQPSTVFSGVAALAIFQEDLADVTQQFRSFTRSSAPAGSVELDAVWSGELNLTTVASPPYGIEAGRSVLLRMLIHSSNGLTCCELKLDEYSTYAGEIVRTYAENVHLHYTVLEWLSSSE